MIKPEIEPRIRPLIKPKPIALVSRGKASLNLVSPREIDLMVIANS